MLVPISETKVLCLEEYCMEHEVSDIGFSTPADDQRVTEDTTGMEKRKEK